MVWVMQPQTFHFLLTGEGVPEWVRLMPMGAFRPADKADKRGPWKLTDPAAVIEASALPLPVDENHTTLAGPVSAPARGWIAALEARDDGLYGRIEWTAAGHALMADKAYRGFSPTFLADKGGVVTRLTGAAITNNPALPELNILTNQETRMDLVQLRAALGLPETADEAAILARITANAAAATSQATQLTAIAQAVGLPADTTAERLVVTLTAQRDGAGQVQTLITQVASLEQQLTAANADRAKEKATAFVAKAILDGKPIVALQERLTAMHIADPTGTEALVNGMPNINAGGVPPGQKNEGGGEVALTATDNMVIAAMGLDPKKFAAERDRQAAQRAALRGGSAV